MSDSSDGLTKLTKMSFGVFDEIACTPETLEEFLDDMEPTLKRYVIERQEAYDHLERIHTVKLISDPAILEDQGDHINWLNPSLNTGLNRDLKWHFWSHYRDYLTLGKNWPKGVVNSIDESSSIVLSRLEDPLREGNWDRRGMVIGSVQSGKTASYGAVIAKAIDAGYKLIVVLAGVHNSLRSQTQYRLNEELLGYDLEKIQEYRGDGAAIGVRLMFKDHSIIQTLTNSSEKGDFKKSTASIAGIIPSADGPATIMVVKKHVSIMQRLTEWATSVKGQKTDKGRLVVPDVPLLVIDDECDYASVNTKKVAYNEDGLIDEECDPAKTNQRIREMLCAFAKSAYVGYTATPFANIFIHHEDQHPTYGRDLFPEHFIFSLPEASNYLGPEKLFGLRANASVGIEEQPPLPLLRPIKDADVIIPPRHKATLVVSELPDSLHKAIKSFLLVCTSRKIRRCNPSHNSMLIHVTRFTDVQNQVNELVTVALRKIVDRIQSGSDDLEDLKELWEDDLALTTDAMSEEFDCEHIPWPEVKENLYSVVKRINVKSIHGKSSDILAYRRIEAEVRKRIEAGEKVEWEERGEHVIAIGGDKLSRGLTLDGLTVSYYLRASRMYDTLMQMGRWFGYRDGYTDLCRIYMTQELMDWYRYIATATKELRQEIEYMHLIDKTPKQFGLKVLSHPGQLAVTSAGKRRNAQALKLSYSGNSSETVVFDPSQSAGNLKALENLIEGCQVDGQRKHETTLLWTGVSPQVVIDYFGSYSTHSKATVVVDSEKIRKFIERQLKFGEDDLTTWDVAVISKLDSKPDHTLNIAGHKIGCVTRKPAEVASDKIAIGRLLSPADEWIDFSDQEKADARDEYCFRLLKKGKPGPEGNFLPSGPAIRGSRPKQRGLLLVYALCYAKDGLKYGLTPGNEVTGFGVSFPASTTTQEVEYMVTSVYQDAEV